jgi:general secretion pathway protein A
MSDSIFAFFGLRENPFKISSDPRFLLVTHESQSAFEQLCAGIQSRKGLLLLTGEVGTGKTMLVRHFLDWLATQKMPTAFLINARLHPDELLDVILHDFSIPCDSAAKTDKLAALNDWLLDRYRAGITPVLVIDEAQGLPTQSLEELRLLLDLETSRDKLLQIVLAGQPELDDTLKQTELRPIRQRIAVHCRTAPLTNAQTQDYVRERLRIAGASQEIFPEDSIHFVHAYARGIPRVINVLCEHSLINCVADGVAIVAPRHVEQAARDCHLERVDSVTRFLSSCSAGDSLADADSILSSVSRTVEVSPATAPRSSFERQFGSEQPTSTPPIPSVAAGARVNPRYAAMAAAAGASHVFQPLPPAAGAMRAPRPPARGALSSTPRPAPSTTFADSTANMHRDVLSDDAPASLSLFFASLRLIVNSFVADARRCWRQTRSFLAASYQRRAKPLLQRTAHAVVATSTRVARWSADPQRRLDLQSWGNRLFASVRSLWPAKRSSTYAEPKQTRALASLQRWLKEPLQPRTRPRHTPPPPRTESRAAPRQQQR